MAVNVTHNMPSISAQRHLSKTQRVLETSLNRLASGLRIVNAADDAAGLAISENLRAQVRGLGMARRNAQDGISLVQTAEGALNETNGMLVRMRELAIQSANGTMGSGERTLINNEFVALRSEVDRLAAVTDFNGISLLSGSTATVQLQVGIFSGANYAITVTLQTATSDALASGLGAAALDTQTNALASLALLDSAISEAASRRGSFGAIQNRLTVAIDTISISEENLTAAEARVRDVDVAAETSAMTRGQILMQAGVSVLAQANQLPSIAMSLIG